MNSKNEKQLKKSGKKYIILRLGSVYGFSTDTSAILGTAGNNLYLKGGDTIYELAIPHGLDDGNQDIYLHSLRKTSASATARLVFT